MLEGLLIFLLIAQWGFILYLLKELIPQWKYRHKVEVLRTRVRSRRRRGKGRPSNLDKMKVDLEVQKHLQEEAEKKEESLPDDVVPY